MSNIIIPPGNEPAILNNFVSIHWYRFFNNVKDNVNVLITKLSELTATVSGILASITTINNSISSISARLTVLENVPKSFSLVSAATYTMASSDRDVAFSAACAVTLPSPSSSIGREFNIKNTAASAITSATSNVVPLAGGSASTSILTNTAGKYARLVSDGTNWIIQSAN